MAPRNREQANKNETSSHATAVQKRLIDPNRQRDEEDRRRRMLMALALAALAPRNREQANDNKTSSRATAVQKRLIATCALGIRLASWPGARPNKALLDSHWL